MCYACAPVAHSKWNVIGLGQCVMAIVFLVCLCVSITGTSDAVMAV